MMAQRPSQYRKVGDFVFEGKVIVGLKRRPDERFYAAVSPTKTFGKHPCEAVTRFLLWQTKVMSGNSAPVSVEYWRLAFGRLIRFSPRLASAVLDIPELAKMEYDPRTLLDQEDWSVLIMPEDDQRLNS